MKLLVVLSVLVFVAYGQKEDKIYGPEPGIFQVKLLKEPRRLDHLREAENKLSWDYARVHPKKNLLKIKVVPIENINYANPEYTGFE